jgi:hypothetical protein
MYGEGKTRGQVTELQIEATINQACAAISVDETKATRAFVKTVLESNYLEMRELAEGGNQPNLNLSKIREFALSLPPLEEQRAITQHVEAILGWLPSLQTRSEALRQIVRRLTPAALAKAFRGELVPQDPNDEPALRSLARLSNDRNSSEVPSTPKRGRKKASRTIVQVEAKMLSRRHVPSTHLTTILKGRGALTPEALWTASELDIDDFYEQLKDEETRGLLRQRHGDASGLTRILEALA